MNQFRSDRMRMQAAMPLFTLALLSLTWMHRMQAQWMGSQPEAYSITGRPLMRPLFPDSQRIVLERNLARAKAEYDENPIEVDRIIWYGRRLAYLWRYQEAIAVFTRGIQLHPASPKLYRHRGHRYITIRQFDKAIEDLEWAAALIQGVPDEVEPDGAPNRYNIPTSTTNSNIWYHLGLAYFLKGDFARAERAFRECLTFSKNDDMLCATSDWLYMTLRRMGKSAEATSVAQAIHRDMKILENHAYFNRLMMYRGERTPESLLAENADDLAIATQGFGVGHWYLVNGDTTKAREVFEKVVAGRYWAAFGFIAAEVELARMK